MVPFDFGATNQTEAHPLFLRIINFRIHNRTVFIGAHPSPLTDSTLETIIIAAEADLQKRFREVLREELAASFPHLQPKTPGYDEPLVSRKEIAVYLKISPVTLHD